MNVVNNNPQRPDVIAEALRLVGRAEADLAGAKTLLRQVDPRPPMDSLTDGAARPLRYLKVSDGRRKVITAREYATLVPEEFRFFLDLAGGRLLTKVDARRPTVKGIAESTLQSEDVRTLAFMIEHAGQYFGADNLAEFMDGQEMLEVNTLARRMVRIRREVQHGQVDGPFIRRATNVDTSVSRTGFGFFFDKDAKPYCLVRFAQSTER